MGLRYEYNIFLPDDALPALLVALSPLLESKDEYLESATPNAGPRRTHIVIDGAVFTLPCTAGFGRGRRVVVSQNDAGDQELELVAYFEADDVILEYQRSNGQPKDYLGIGYVYATIHRTPTISRMTFTAATSGMSVLFRSSPSIRQTFATLGERCRANLVVLDLEADGFETIEEPARRATVPVERWTDDGAYSVVDTPTLFASLVEALRRDDDQRDTRQP
ncbi:MAG: hypothetical protein JNK05_38420 [Myxococcales bacterium]|nr:hypothetical protein [Myxococcales bacterium]